MITEKRFKDLTFFQWVFHYNEICNVHRGIQKVQLDRLDNIETSLQAFYLLVDIDNGQKLIEHLNDIRREKNNIDKKEINNNSNGAGNNKTNNVNDDELDLLSDEEKDLWSFMNEQPAFIAENRSMKNVGKHILPTKSKEDLIKGQAKIVKKLDKVPKLGFEG